MPIQDNLKEKDTLVAFIKAHPEAFQYHFQFIAPLPRRYGNLKQHARMINLNKYQNQRVIISTYYKHISRSVIL